MDFDCDYLEYSSSLNYGQQFFILMGVIPLAILIPMWCVAKFVYDPMLVAEKKKAVEISPYHTKYPLKNAKDDGIKLIKDTYLIEQTPDGNVFMSYDYDREGFIYWSDKIITWKNLETVARKFVTTFKCKDLYIDRLALQKQKFIKARNKYLKQLKRQQRQEIDDGYSEDDEESKSEEDPVKDLFVKTASQKAKDHQENYMVGKNKDGEEMVSLKKLLTTKKANKFTKKGKLEECPMWNVGTKEKKKLVSNISFSAFKKLFE